MVYVAPVWQGKCCRRCNHLVFQDECLNCTDRCFNLSSGDYIQYVWEISRSFHLLFYVIIAFFCSVRLFTFLQHNEHPSIHPFSIPAPSGSFTFFSPLVNNAHLFLIEFLWEYITVTVFTPACPPWIGFVCIRIPHFEGWVHELLRRLHGHEIQKKKKKVRQDTPFHFWGAACRSRLTMRKYRIDQHEDSLSFLLSCYFKILAIEYSVRETNLFSFSSPCAYLHLSPLFRTRAFGKTQGCIDQNLLSVM